MRYRQILPVALFCLGLPLATAEEVQSYEAYSAFGSGKQIQFKVQNSMASWAWMVPYAIEPMNRIDGAPYHLEVVPVSSTSTNNDMWAGYYPGSSWLGYGTVGCSSNSADCEVIINTAYIYSGSVGDNYSYPWVSDLQTIMAHEFMHWAGQDHTYPAVHRTSSAATGQHGGTQMGLSWVNRWLNTDDGQAVAMSSPTSFGRAMDMSFENPAYPNSWGSNASGSLWAAQSCAASSWGSCSYRLGGSGWSSVYQDFWNYGTSNRANWNVCFSVRSEDWSSPTTVTPVVWDLSNNSYGYNVFTYPAGDGWWHQVCAGKGGLSSKPVRIELYNNNPYKTVYLDEARVTG